MGSIAINIMKSESKKYN